MVIDAFYENGIKIIFSYFPAWEMFFSMHVLANPEHHGTRKKWVDEKEKQFPEMVSAFEKKIFISGTKLLIIPELQ